MIMSRNNKKHASNSKGGNNMNAVLSIDEYRQELSPPKNKVYKRNISIKPTKDTLGAEETKKVFKYESRASSADESPLLWDDGEDS